MPSQKASLRGLLVAVPLAALLANACVGDDPSAASTGSDGDASAGGDGTTSTGDGATTGDGQTTPPGPCNLAADFGKPTAVAGLTGLYSIARFSQDELTAYFSYGTDGGVPSIFRAERTSISGSFGAPIPMPELVISGAISGENHPTVSTSGLTIYYVVSNWLDGGMGEGDLVYAQRANVDASFGVPSLVPGMNTAADEEEPYVAASGDLWFATDRDIDGGGTDHLYRASNAGSGLGAPSAETDVNSLSDSDQYPVVSNDGLTLYFSRRGSDTQLLDVFVATRDQASHPFSAPATLASVNSTDNERASWISPDGCRLYVTRGIVPNPFDVYVASKPAK